MIVRIISCLILSLISSISAWAGGTPQGTAWTYQGLIRQSGAPVNGPLDLRFQIWDAITDGSQVGSNVDFAGLTIVEGLFTVDLDFGPLVFDGGARWLQVQVVTNGGATVTSLSPRQRVNAAPYALFALAADGTNVTNLNASHLSSGTVPNSQLGGSYSNATTFSNSANSFTGEFIGSGAALAELNASSVSSGSLPIARLPSGGEWTLSSNLNIDSNTLVVDQANNRIGIGTPTPAAPLHVRTFGPFFVLQDTASSSQQAGYVGFWNSAGTETGWVGYGSPGSPHMSMFNGRSGGNIALLPNSNVGIGTTSPAAKLDVRGDIRLGSSGQFRATAGDENLRIIRGSVGITGQIVAGSGFTVQLVETAKYLITFTTPFSGRPAVTATSYRSDPCCDIAEMIVMIQSVSPSSVTLVTRDVAFESWKSWPFDFIVVGSRIN